MSTDIDRELRTALDADVADVVADEALWARIQASLDAEPAAQRARRPRRARGALLAAAAVVLLAGVATALAAGPELGPGVVTHPGPPDADAPGTTTSTTAGTTDPPAAAGPPTRALAVLADGRVVHLDLARQAIGAPIGRVYSPDDPPLPEERNLDALTALDVTHDGRTVYYSLCCEPASGVIRRVARAGFALPDRTPFEFAAASVVAVAPDDRWVATARNEVPVPRVVVHTRDGAPVAETRADGPGSVDALWWSPDGTRLAVGYDDYDPGTQQHQRSIGVLRWNGHALSAEAGDPVPGSAVRWDAGGDPVVLPDRPLASRPTADGRWTLVVDADGHLQLLDAGGRPTPLFHGVRFQLAEPIDPAARS